MSQGHEIKINREQSHADKFCPTASELEYTRGTAAVGSARCGVTDSHDRLSIQSLECVERTLEF